MNYRKLYDTLLETEELYLMFPNFKGVWEKDKKNFIKYQKKIENLDITLEDVEEELNLLKDIKYMPFTGDLEILKLEVQEDEDYDNIR